MSKSLMGLLNFKEKFFRFNLIALSPILVKVLLVYIFKPFHIENIILIVFFINLFYGLFCVVYTFSEISFKFKIEKLFLSIFFKFSFKSFLSTTLKSFHQNSDKILVNIFLGNMYVGILDVLQKILRLSRMLINPISTVLLPDLSKSYKLQKNINYKNIFKTSVFLLSVVSLSIFFIFLFKKPIYYIIGIDASVISNYLLILFLLIGLGKSLAWWVRVLPLSVGRPEIPIWTNLIQIFFINIGYIILIPKFELYGVGVIRFIAPFFTMIFVYYILKTND